MENSKRSLRDEVELLIITGDIDKWDHAYILLLDTYMEEDIAQFKLQKYFYSYLGSVNDLSPEKTKIVNKFKEYIKENHDMSYYQSKYDLLEGDNSLLYQVLMRSGSTSGITLGRSTTINNSPGTGPVELFFGTSTNNT